MDLIRTELNLADLNDDCLHILFEYLPNKDLVAVSQCCSRFNDIVTDTMRPRMRKTTAQVLDRVPFPVVKKYGNEIRNLKAELPWEGNHIQHVRDISALCPNVSILHIHHLTDDMFTQQFPAELFIRLKELDIGVHGRHGRARDANIEKIMQQCKQLTSLSITGFHVGPFLAVRYPSLASFAVSSSDLDEIVLRDFFKKNDNLESLKLIGVEGLDYRECLPELMRLKNLTKLELYNSSHNRYDIEGFTEMVEGLDVITTLRLLTVKGVFCDAPDFGGFKQLEFLKVELDEYKHENTFWDARGFGIFKLPNLRKLFLRHSNESDVELHHLVSFVRKHPQLETLEISGFRREIYDCEELDDDHRKFQEACEMASLHFYTWEFQKNYFEWWNLGRHDIANLIRNYVL